MRRALRTEKPAAAAEASWLLPDRRLAMNKLRWWLVSGAGIPRALRIGARVACTHLTGQRACRRPANFIVAEHLVVCGRSLGLWRGLRNLPMICWIDRIT